MIKILQAEKIDVGKIFARNARMPDIEKTVSAIIADVRERGDDAVREYTERFDRAVPERIEVTAEEKDRAMNEVDADLIRVFERSAANIRKFHSAQTRQGFIINDERGIVTGQKVIPIERVGIYVPGGTAPLSSTVLMNAIPAKIAGCGCIVMATPPDKNGMIAPEILAAAKISGVDRIFKVGGAQAIAALAYGTESIPKVDKIVGPGNAYVAEAKKQVFGDVSIDMIAGPSEILIVADGKSSPRRLAADMLSQAEHDKMACAVLVTDSEALADAVSAELEEQLRTLPREETARASIEENGKIIVTRDIAAAVDIANAIAPEHLELCVDAPFDLLDRVKNAGSVFLGRYSPEALGDYLSGANHTLPTRGTARFSSPLSVDDFVKKTQYTYYTKEAFANAAEDIARFARAEALEAHARSALSRIDGE